MNVYLLEGSPLTLVDTGVNTGTALDTLERVLEGLGYRLEDIELLLLTHEHADHVGLSSIIARRADCPVAAYAPLQAMWDPEQDAAHILGSRLAWGVAQLERHGYPHELVIGAQPTFHLLSALSARPVVDIALRPGEQIRAGDRDWEIHHRPGHSPSDLLFVDRSTGTAIAGDHVLGGTSSNPVLSPPLEVLVPDETTERLKSLQLFVASLKQTAADDLSLLLPGHGALVGPPADLIAGRLAFHEKRAAKFLDMLDPSQPQTVYELATRMWKGVVMVQPSLTHSEDRPPRPARSERPGRRGDRRRRRRRVRPNLTRGTEPLARPRVADALRDARRIGPRHPGRLARNGRGQQHRVRVRDLLDALHLQDLALGRARTFDRLAVRLRARVAVDDRALRAVLAPDRGFTAVRERLDVGTATANRHGVAALALKADRVRTAADGDRVVPGATADEVAAVPERDDVRAAAAVDEVVPVAGLDARRLALRLRAAGVLEPVGPEDVVATLAVDEAAAVAAEELSGPSSPTRLKRSHSPALRDWMAF